MSQHFPFSESGSYGALTSHTERVNAGADNIAACVHITCMLYLGILPWFCCYQEFSIEKNAPQKIAEISRISHINYSISAGIDNQLKVT